MHNMSGEDEVCWYAPFCVKNKVIPTFTPAPSHPPSICHEKLIFGPAAWVKFS